MNFPSTCRIASIIPNDAMILPHNANLRRMTFSERTRGQDRKHQAYKHQAYKCYHRVNLGDSLPSSTRIRFSLHTGLGRESGQDSIYEFLQTKSVWISFADKVANPFILR